MSEPVRLAKRVVEVAGCSRREAEQYIEGGWVRVDGEMVDLPQFKVLDQAVTLDPEAQAGAVEPATLLLHKPTGIESVEGPEPAARLLSAQSHAADDASGIRVLRRHFARLTALLPLESRASGLLTFTQDGRLLHHMRQDADRLEQEFIVEVAGQIAPDGLDRLSHGMRYNGRALAPIKVSWQNETRLRFALKAAAPGQIPAMCAEVGLQVVAMKRIRIGRIPLGRMAVGEWRYLAPHERF